MLYWGSQSCCDYSEAETDCKGGHLVFIRVLSLSKFRSWLADGFSSNRDFCHSMVKQKESTAQSF